MTDHWYYAKQGQRLGPISSQNLKQLAASGQISPTDLIWRKGMANWAPAEKVKGLTFASPPPLTPPSIRQPPASANSTDDRRPVTTGSSNHRKYVATGSIIGVVLLVGAFLVLHSMNGQKPVSATSESIARKSVSDIPIQSSARLPKTVRVPSRSAVPLDLPAIPDVGRMTRAIQEESNRSRQRPPTIPQQNNQPTSTDRRDGQRSSGRLKSSNNTTPPSSQADTHGTRREMVPLNWDMLLIDTPEKTVTKWVPTGGKKSYKANFGDAPDHPSPEAEWNWTANVRSLAFTDNGNLLLAEVHTSDGCNWFKVFERASWEEIPLSKGPKHETAVPLPNAIALGGRFSLVNKTVAVSPDGRMIVTNNGNMWNLAARPIHYVGHADIWGERYSGHAQKRGLPALSQDGTMVVLPHPEGSLQFVRLGNPPRVVGRINGNMWEGASENLLAAVALASNARMLAVVTQSKVLIYSVPNGQVLATLKLPKEASNNHSLDSTIQVGFSPDGSLLATVHKIQGDSESEWGEHQIVAVWDTTTWKQQASLSSLDVMGFDGDKNESNFGFRGFSADGTRIVTTAGGVERETTVSIWDSSSGKKLSEFITPCRDNMAVFTPDGKRIITCGPDPTLFATSAWKSGDGPSTRPLDTVAVNNNVYIWDAATGLLCGRIKDSHAECFALAPDGKLVATVSPANDLAVWDITKGKRIPYEDIYTEYRLAKNMDAAEAAKLRERAAPITREQYLSVQVGMDRMQVRKLLGGSGRSKVDVYSIKSKFGFKWITKTTYTYPCADGNTATFVFEGEGTIAPLTEKRHSGEW